jgi:hypothetical protein
VHTAGVSPVQATPAQIVAVDVIGTARVLDAFEPHVEAGTVAVCIVSMAGTMTPLDAETLARLATTPTDRLSALEVLDPATLDVALAYGVAKRIRRASRRRRWRGGGAAGASCRSAPGSSRRRWVVPSSRDRSATSCAR